MNNNTIKLQSGLNVLQVEVSYGTTVGEVLENPNYAAVLNFDASNVEGLIDGVVANAGTILASGDTLLISRRAHSKAA